MFLLLLMLAGCAAPEPTPVVYEFHMDREVTLILASEGEVVVSFEDGATLLLTVDKDEREY
jgi:hypothetical protein